MDAKLALGIYDPLSAILSDANQPDFLWLSSYCFSLSQAVPDVGAFSFPFQEQLLTRILAVSTTPLLIDIDNGALSKRHNDLLATKLRHLGVAGFAIEDKAGGKESSLYDVNQELLNVDSFAEKIARFRKAGRKLILMARLEGLNYAEDTEEVVKKARACTDAGADYIIIHNTQKDLSPLREVVTECGSFTKIALIPTTYLDSLDRLNLRRTTMIILANQLLRARIKSTKNILKQMRRSLGGLNSLMEDLADTNALILE